MLLVLTILTLSIAAISHADTIELTNVSYDPTRELYAAYNKLFEAHYEEEYGQKVSVTQSHGGSGKQALEVANGLEADVVTLALEGDVQVVANAGLIDEGFTAEFDLDSSPYTSTIVFLVRSGNPKEIMIGTTWSGTTWVSSPRIRKPPGARCGITLLPGIILNSRDRAKRKYWIPSASCTATWWFWIPVPVAPQHPLWKTSRAMYCWHGKTKPSFP